MVRPLRILHLRSSSMFGSPERLILDQVLLLPPADFRCAIASFRHGLDGQALLDEAARRGAEAVPIPDRGVPSPLPILTLRQSIRGWRPNILCMHDYKANVIGLLASRSTPVRKVSVFHGWTSESVKMRAYEVLDRWALRRMDHLATVSDASRRRLLALGFPPNRITTIRNGIDAPRFAQNATQPASEVKASLGLPTDARLVVSAGRLSAEKGHGFLLDAFRAVIQHAPDARLVLLGDGPERDRLCAQTRSLGIAGQVVFAGFRRDVAAVFHAMEFLVLPSLSEGLPMVVLEAFACSKPVVATAVGGVPEVIEDGRSGLLVPAADAARLGQAITALLSDTSTREQMALHALTVVQSRFGIEAYVAAFARLFRTMGRTLDRPISA